MTDFKKRILMIIAFFTVLPSLISCATLFSSREKSLSIVSVGLQEDSLNILLEIDDYRSYTDLNPHKSSIKTLDVSYYAGEWTDKLNQKSLTAYQVGFLNYRQDVPYKPQYRLPVGEKSVLVRELSTFRYCRKYPSDCYYSIDSDRPDDGLKAVGVTTNSNLYFFWNQTIINTETGENEIDLSRANKLNEFINETKNYFSPKENSWPRYVLTEDLKYIISYGSASRVSGSRVTKTVFLYDLNSDEYSKKVINITNANTESVNIYSAEHVNGRILLLMSYWHKGEEHTIIYDLKNQSSKVIEDHIDFHMEHHWIWDPFGKRIISVNTGGYGGKRINIKIYDYLNQKVMKYDMPYKLIDE